MSSGRSYKSIVYNVSHHTSLKAIVFKNQAYSRFYFSTLDVISSEIPVSKTHSICQDRSTYAIQYKLPDIQSQTVNCKLSYYTRIQLLHPTTVQASYIHVGNTQATLNSDIRQL